MIFMNFTPQELKNFSEKLLGWADELHYQFQTYRDGYQVASEVLFGETNRFQHYRYQYEWHRSEDPDVIFDFRKVNRIDSYRYIFKKEGIFIETLATKSYYDFRPYGSYVYDAEAKSMYRVVNHSYRELSVFEWDHVHSAFLSLRVLQSTMHEAIAAHDVTI